MLYTSIYHYWAANKFKLQKISSDSLNIMKKLPVLVVGNIFCKIYAKLLSMGTERNLELNWHKWSYCRQDLVE